MAVQAIAGTVTVTANSAAIVFSQAQTLAAGTTIVFAAQPSIPYQLLSAIAAGTAGTLTTPYTGLTNASLGTTVQRQIIVLDYTQIGNGLTQVNVVFWLVAPPNRVLPQPGFTSAVPSNVPAPPTSTELAMLISGQLVEKFDGAVQGATAAAIETALAARYVQAQAALTAQAANAKYVNAYFDGNTWTLPP
jgi:hypothetical protein